MLVLWLFFEVPIAYDCIQCLAAALDIVKVS